jgi:hypothetical protein
MPVDLVLAQCVRADQEATPERPQGIDPVSEIFIGFFSIPSSASASRQQPQDRRSSSDH